MMRELRSSRRATGAEREGRPDLRLLLGARGAPGKQDGVTGARRPRARARSPDASSTTPVVTDAGIRRLQFDGTTMEPLTMDAPFVSGKVPVADYAREYLVPSLAELVGRTNPDILWFDGEWESAPGTWRSPELAAYFYNRAAARGQDVAINDRFGRDTRGKAGWGDFSPVSTTSSRASRRTRGRRTGRSATRMATTGRSRSTIGTC